MHLGTAGNVKYTTRVQLKFPTVRQNLPSNTESSSEINLTPSEIDHRINLALSDSPVKAIKKVGSNKYDKLASLYTIAPRIK